jgi:hypothetical protein
VGVLAIKNKDESKKAEIPIITQEASDQSGNIAALKIANDSINFDTQAIQTMAETNKNSSSASGSIVAKKAASSTVKNTASQSKTSTASTSQTKTTSVSTPAPAPKPAPAPAPAKVTKTS